ncbi:tetratricopeptide repeat protein [Nostoc sp. WHI]|uniref:tetratricopeptide repeat protein n=1 Tax=Nostoc sp. WHI TaxID=2650611 RepID=UPI0018C574D0|nr:tetratricopeptide repeat protein [Nostoc sp. WHI]MBG1271363.1 tetratricopeptide repeat protein [Nostoc sp. WHI]
MRHHLKCLTLATVALSLVPLSVCLPLYPAPLVAQAQTTQKQIAEQALQLYQKATEQFKQGQFQEALKTLKQVLAIMKELGLQKAQGTILNNIGLVYSNLGQYPQALESYE